MGPVDRRHVRWILDGSGGVVEEADGSHKDAHAQGAVEEDR